MGREKSIMEIVESKIRKSDTGTVAANCSIIGSVVGRDVEAAMAEAGISNVRNATTVFREPDMRGRCELLGRARAKRRWS